MTKTKADLMSTATRSGGVFDRGSKPVEIRNGVARFMDEGRASELAIRQVEVRANTAVEATAADGTVARTVEVVWTTGASVTRYSWDDRELYDEVLEVSSTAIRMGRMEAGASVLNSHWNYDINDVLGVVESVRLEDGKGIATIRIANTPDLDNIWPKIKDGIIRHISVGYYVYEWQVTRNAGQRTQKVAVDWEPFEISFVPVPADMGCTVRSDNLTAPEQEDDDVKRNAAATVPVVETVVAAGADTRSQPAPATAAETQLSVTAERQRCADINRYASVHGIDDAARNAAIEAGTSFADFCRAQVDAAAEAARSTQVQTHRNTVVSERSPEQEMELRSQAFGAVELQRAGIRAPEISAEARSFASEGLRGIAALALRTAGVSFNPNASDNELIARAFEVSARGMLGTADLGTALGNTLHLALDQGYESQVAETNYERWAGSTTVRDFKVNKAVHVGFLTGIRDVVEGGELALAKLGSGARYFSLATRGLKVAFTRQAIINDEFGALLQAVNKLGMVYRHDEQGIATAALMAGTMVTEAGEEDIFHANHNNLVELDAFDKDGVSLLIMALRGQRFETSKVAKDAPASLRSINVNPKMFLLSADLESKFLDLNERVVGQSSPYAGRFEYEVINELPDGTGFLTGAGALSDVIQVARLASAQGPQINALPASSYLGSEWESYNDFTAFGVGRTGIVKFTVSQ